MPLTVKVNGQMFGLVHKASNHLANSTAPDVCNTPSPTGPVPIPYPVIISQSSDLSNGTTTVTADGGQMIAIKDCEYATCTGDEAGSAGGVVSGTFTQEAKFILFSMDVKMDGKNACRFGDKMTMNHQNTVCMSGTTPTVVSVADIQNKLCQIIKECEQEWNQKIMEQNGDPTSYGWCKAHAKSLGNLKHDCAAKKIDKEKAKTPPGLPADVQNSPKIKVPGGGNIIPDVTVGLPPNCQAVFDFKTSCPIGRPKPGESIFPTYFSDPADRKLFPGSRKAPNPNYNGQRQDQIYSDVCGAETTAIHANGENCN
jgi:hypothetical protein